MDQASPGGPSPPAAPSSAAPRSRLSRTSSGSADEPSLSVRTLLPTTGRESLLAHHLKGKHTGHDAERNIEESPHPDGLRIPGQQKTKWLIGSPSEDRLASMIHGSSKRTRSPDDQSDEVAVVDIHPWTPTSNPLPSSSLTSASTMSPANEVAVDTPVSPRDGALLIDSIESIAAKLNISPQTIPETSTVDHSLYSPITSPNTDYDWDPLSRNSSTRSMRMARTSRITGAASRRSSRRSNSRHNTSVSPALAYLSAWSKGEDPVPEPQPDDEGQSIGLDNEYIIGRTLNRGGFAVIKEVHSLPESGERVVRAVKIIRKTNPDRSEAENEKAQQTIEHEVSIWRHLKHRHVLSLHAAYDTDFATFCVMDLNVGGTLFDHLRVARKSAAQNGGRRGLRAEHAKRYTYQLACVLRYLHEDVRVCHRDVKLENCLVDMSTPNAEEEGGNLRLCDFGLADFLHSETLEESSADGYTDHLSLSTELPVPTASSIIGTLEYASPKGLSVNRKLYETAGDVWAFGVAVYALCTGDLPFRHSLPSKVVELIMLADWNVDALRHAAAGSEDVIELVKGCLEKDIDLRFTISDALRSPWFEGCREAAEEQSANGWA